MTCDLCDRKDLTSFIDGKTIMGPWAKMCPLCYEEFGVGLGIGRGQLYNYYAKEQAFKQEAGGTKPGLKWIGA